MPIVNVKPNTMTWHELRSRHVGASEVAAIFNASPYLTHLELWLNKAGKLNDNYQESDRQFWGKRLEAIVAEGVCEKMSWQLVQPKGYYIDDVCKGLAATPDYFIYKPADPKRTGCLEIKNVDYLQFKNNWADEPPLQYILQLQTQLACTGYEWGAIAAFIGGNNFEVYEYERHEPTILRIRLAVKAFWESIWDGKEPSIVADDYDILKGLYPAKKGEHYDLTSDNELPELCAHYLEANRFRKEAEKAENELKARIINKLGVAETASTNGYFIKFPEFSKEMKAKEAHTITYRQLTVKEITQ